MAKLVDQECSASECSLICNDYWRAGYGRIIMVPRVKLAYDKVSSWFSLLYPILLIYFFITGLVADGFELPYGMSPTHRVSVA